MEEKYINTLLKLAFKAYKKGEAPIAAIIIENDTGKIISKAYNNRNKTNLTINHAEIIAIIKANKKYKNWRLNNCSLYITLEPCEMCKTVIKESRIVKTMYLIERNKDKKQYNKGEYFKIDNYQNLEKEYVKLLNNFWKNKR